MDYFNKAPDFFGLELKIISAIELHVARSIVLRHDDDPGFKGQDWHGAVEDWNTALAWRHPMTYVASDIDGVLDKIINGEVVISLMMGKQPSPSHSRVSKL